MLPVRLPRPTRLQRSSLLLDHHAAPRPPPPHLSVAQRPVRHLPPRRNLHASRPTRALGFKLPEPSNEPLAGTVADGSGPPWLFLLQVLVGLPTALWAYKCLMLVLFQRRIIYLPSVPPGMRDEPVPHQTGELAVKEVHLQSTEPSRWLRRTVKLRGIEVEWRGGKVEAPAGPERRVVIVYLQGNAGTPLLRLPVFRKLLKPDPTTARSSQPRITVLAVAPRSYWLSDRTTPTERGVLADCRAAVTYAQERYGPNATYILYGHSLGGAAAVLLLRRQRDSSPQIAGVVLENPLPSIPYMVRALYPQKWLPYHYLGPFAFDKWDALSAIEQEEVVRGSGAGVRRRQRRRRLARLPPSLWIRSGRDEIIPHGANDGVEQMYARWMAAAEVAADLDLPATTAASGTNEAESNPGSPKQVRPPPPQADDDDHREVKPFTRDHVSTVGRARWIDIPHALHDTAYMEQRWREEIRRFVDELSLSSERKAES
ncbi:hypothetical protein C6P46_002935 [Rhodotorula mucilaginosa]|uniref:Serine aminopeptidase S33 domain-containing protein n=1 Tax=Rhodotorula mucilaginosa TaxID=5537 RepID=A0A9P6W5G1_RHOMI|nr:hypothetical protein C6P46_002935 [Rhodotorula mucilaginosa]